MRPLILIFGATAAILTSCSAQPGAPGSGNVVRTPLGMRLDSTLTQAAREGFSGVALVEKDGEIVLKKGYGLANRREKIPMTPATVVQIGSNTKDFTAVAILQLAERGRLRLEDSIGKYFPNVPADKRAITIQQLLRHRAGFPQHLGPDFDSVTRADEIRMALAAPLSFEPGKGHAYSNVGFSLLGAIIEQLTGKSYDEYVRDEILQPSGLKDTGFLLPNFDSRRLAHGYRGEEDRGTIISKAHAADGPYWNLRANGGMLSTVSDMHRFYRVLAGTALLKPETRDVMFPPDEPVVLAGSDMVSSFLYNREPREKLTIIVASNTSRMSAVRIRDRLAAVLGLGSEGAPEREIVTAGPAGQSAPRAAPTLTALPHTPAGRTVLAYLRAYNTGDTAVMRPFMRDSIIQSAGDKRTLDERLSRYRQIHADLGTLKLLGVVSATPTQIVARMASEKVEQVTMMFDVEANAPYRLRGLRVEAR